MKKQYMIPSVYITRVVTMQMISTSEVMEVKSEEFGDDNEKEKGGAGVLSRQSLWEDDEAEDDDAEY